MPVLDNTKNKRTMEPTIYFSNRPKNSATEPARRDSHGSRGSFLSCIFGLVASILLFMVANPGSGLLHIDARQPVNRSLFSFGKKQGNSTGVDEWPSSNGRMGLASEQ